jgi:hypothetical protein
MSSRKLTEIARKPYDGELWTPEQIAARHHSCIATVHRRAKRFGIEKLKLGGKKVLYRPDDILKLEESCAV